MAIILLAARGQEVTGAAYALLRRIADEYAGRQA